MKYGDSARFSITSVDKKGRGCGNIDGKVACMHFVAPGEIVEGTLIRRRNDKRVFELTNVVQASPHRITPPCPYVGTCGGCAWQQFDYPFQLELKKDLVNRALESGEVPLRIDEVEAAPEQLYYRNRMDYVFGWKGELGLKRPGRWNSYVNLESCHLLSPQTSDVLRIVREHAAQHGIEPWDGKRSRGYLRYCVIREGKRTGERMITLITSPGEIPGREELVASLAPFATTIYHGVNASVTDISYAASLELLHGNEFLTEIVDGKKFLVHPNSFFQTNTVMAERLVATVREFIGAQKPKTLLDLYCGGGMFGIALAGDAERVIGVEVEPSAIEMAKKNAELNGLANTSFFAEKAEQHGWDDIAPDTVIVDPPRAGLHPNVVKDLLRNRPPRIVYISCNVERFAEEWKQLSAAYRIDRIRALDLFPHTPHAEVVSLLTRI
jgi:tRNA (uracil-5-)-methyltransferase